MAEYTYFLSFRYQHADHVTDANTVVRLSQPITTETDVREIERELAAERGIAEQALGLLNIVQLRY